MAPRPLTPEKACERLEALCSRAERSCHELRQKLYAWGIAGQRASDIIEALQAEGSVDDERFARAYVADKVRFVGWGRVKIRQNLRLAHRIDPDIIDQALETIDPEEYERILEQYLRQRARAIEDIDSYEGRQRLFRAGISRGFEPSLVARIIRSGAANGE